jgi:hypothetical protein
MRRLALLFIAVLAVACADKVGPLTVTAVDSPAPAGATLPTLTTDASGRTVLSWMMRGADSVPELQFAVMTGDDQWSAPRTAVRDSALLVNWADVGAVVPTDDGRLVAYWMKRVPGPFAYDLYVASSGDGGATWSTPVVPHMQARPGEHGFVSIVSRAEGGAELQFLNGTYAPESAYVMALQHVQLDDTGALLPVPAPIDVSVCDCCQTDVARTSDGVIVAYRDRTSDEIRDIYVLRRGASGWSEPVRVHEDAWNIDGCPVNGPAVAADGNNVVVAWYTAARDTARVRVAFSRDGGATFAAPTDLAVGPSALGRVDVTWLADGRALVSWLDRTREAATVTVAAVTTEGVVSWEGTVGETTATRPSGFPRMTRRGDAVWVAWTVPGDSARVEMGVVGR